MVVFTEIMRHERTEADGFELSGTNAPVDKRRRVEDVAYGVRPQLVYCHLHTLSFRKLHENGSNAPYVFTVFHSLIVQKFDSFLILIFRPVLEGLLTATEGVALVLLVCFFSFEL